ncbi:hypothetical protein [Akkermansia muciniphila]|uniref:hypothetical protein n=2 Tax=Akkermansia muciniphila TaxID=239935 RepID=UPI00319E09F5
MELFTRVFKVKIITIIIHIPLILFIPVSLAHSRPKEKPIDINTVTGKISQERYTRQQIRSILFLYLSQQQLPPTQTASKEETFNILKAKENSLYVLDYVRSAQSWREVCTRVKKALKWIHSLSLQPDDHSQKNSLDSIQKIFLALTIHNSSNSLQNKNLRILIGYAYLVPSLRTALQSSSSSISREVIRAAEIYTLLCRQQKKLPSSYAIEMYNLLLQIPSITSDEKAKFAYFLAYLYLNTNQYRHAAKISKLIPPIEGMKGASSRIQKQALQRYQASSRK